MNLVLCLPDRLEQALKREAAKSGMEVEAFVLEAVKKKIEPRKSRRVRRRKSSTEEFKKKLQETISIFSGTSHFVDDSRESIYSREDEWNKSSNE